MQGGVWLCEKPACLAVTLLLQIILLIQPYLHNKPSLEIVI